MEAFGIAATGPDVRSLVKETVVHAPPLEVWSAWTTKASIDSWWGPPDARIELRVGGPYELLFLSDEPEGRQGSEGCRILAYVPGEMLAFTWNARPDHPLRESHTWVVLTFSEAGDGTTAVRLVHTGFLDGPDWDTYVAYFEDAWARVLDRLADHWAG
jgi:uncharacterized protein YndB with AHSA1/START domain